MLEKALEPVFGGVAGAFLNQSIIDWRIRVRIGGWIGGRMNDFA